MVVVEAVVLVAAVVAVVVPSFRGVSHLAPGATPGVYFLFPDASPSVLAASGHAYLP